MTAPAISVLILTKNEERDLRAALASVSWSDDIHVFDSHSTDGTQEIARAAGAQLHTRAFDDYATHRNAAFTLPFKHPWVFLLDADERPTSELSAEMQRVVTEAPANTAGFRLRRRDFLFGTWLKHAQISPYYIRLVRPERSRYTRAINEVLEVDGPVAELLHPLDHYPFSKGIAHWLAKHNTYSTMEAELIVRQQGLQKPSLRTAVAGPDFHTAPHPPEGALLPDAWPAADQVVLHDVSARRDPGRSIGRNLRDAAILVRVHDRAQDERTAPRRCLICFLPPPPLL